MSFSRGLDGIYSSYFSITTIGYILSRQLPIVKSIGAMMPYSSSWRLFIIFAVCPFISNLAQSRNYFIQYYLTNPNATTLSRRLKAPIDVWPGRLMENYTKLKVSERRWHCRLVDIYNLFQFLFLYSCNDIMFI